VYYGVSQYYDRRIRRAFSGEFKQLLISALIVAIAFSVREIISLNYLKVLAIIVAVAFAFIFHEILHRYVAKKLGYYAKYQIWPTGLMLALILSIVTLGRVVFAAPGAVVVFPKFPFGVIDRRDYGKIAASGPLANIVLGYIALVVLEIFPIEFLNMFTRFALITLIYMKTINLWLALFNLIPFPPLDGSKVFAWSKIIWAIMFILAALPLFILPLVL